MSLPLWRPVYLELVIDQWNVPCIMDTYDFAFFCFCGGVVLFSGLYTEVQRCVIVDAGASSDGFLIEPRYVWIIAFFGFTFWI